MRTSDPLRYALRPRPPRSQMTAGDLIAAQAVQQPHAVCFVDDHGRTTTFGEVNSDVNRLARAFLARGWQRGDRVAILGTDSVEYVEVVMACLKVGLVYCCLNVRLREVELADMVDRLAPVALVAGGGYLEVAHRLAAGLPAPVPTLALDEPATTVDSVRADLESVDDDSDVEVCTEREEIAAVAFTSGTTGRPKAVLQSARMVRETIMGGLREIRVSQDDFRYNGPPLFHVSGLGSVMSGVAAGCRTLLLSQFSADRVVHWMQHGLTSVFLVPTMLSSVLKHPDLTKVEYPDLRTLIYGASPMTPALLRRVLDVFGCDLYNIFGPGTEGAWQATLTPDDHRTALAGRPELLESVGRPAAGIALKIVDDDFVEVPRGVVGHIVSRSETVMSGYLDQPELEGFALREGWLRSGDLARMEEDGYLYLASRTADMIIRGGENVYPIEIESRLAEHASVAQVAVVGLPDEHWGEVIAAAVVCHEGTEGDADELRTFCRAAVASFKVPSVVEFFDELPLNATGKVQKSAVGELIDARVRAAHRGSDADG